MADILRITTPLVNKSQAPDAQKALEATQPFDLHNITRVTKPAGQEDFTAEHGAKPAGGNLGAAFKPAQGSVCRGQLVEKHLSAPGTH